MNWLLLFSLFFPTKGNRSAANIVTWIGRSLSTISLWIFFIFGAKFLYSGEANDTLWATAIGIAILAAICDWIDGPIARKFGGSDFGKSYDPAIDKIQLDQRIFAILIDLMVRGTTSYMFVFIIFGYLLRHRNERVSFLRNITLKLSPDAEVQALYSGKVRTASCYIGTLALHLCIYGHSDWMFYGIITVLTLINEYTWGVYSWHYCPHTSRKETEEKAEAPN